MIMQLLLNAQTFILQSSIESLCPENYTIHTLRKSKSMGGRQPLTAWHLLRLALDPATARLSPEQEGETYQTRRRMPASLHYRQGLWALQMPVIMKYDCDKGMVTCAVMS